MYIVEVIPLTNLPPNVPQLLSYFFDDFLEKGSVVEIVIGRRKVQAIVVSSTPLEKQKGALKRSLFQLKKISKVITTEKKVSDIQLKILLLISRNYYAPLGTSLKTVIPSFFLKAKAPDPKIEKGAISTKPRFIIGNASETLKSIRDSIKDHVREGQILVLVPDKRVLEFFKDNLNSNPLIFHSGQTQKQQKEVWNKTADGAPLVIATRQGLFLPFKNLKLVVVDDPTNDLYKSEMAPKYIASDLAEKISDLYGAKLIFTSPALGLLNYYKTTEGKLGVEYGKKNNPPIKIVSMLEEIKTDNFSSLSKELGEEIIDYAKKNKRILVFCPRRGHSSLVLCQNCSEPVKCKNCSTPMRVHKNTDLILICHRCSFSRDFPKFCTNCNSYKLKTAGTAGSQKIYDEIRYIIEGNDLKANLLILDSDVVKNDTEEDEIIKEAVSGSKSFILIATQMIFSHRYSLGFDLVGITNFDALTVNPDFQMDEKVLYTAQKIMGFQPKKIIIQTYNPDSRILSVLRSQDFDQFYKPELEIRKMLSYPPFSRLMKLTFKHKDQKRAAYEARLLVERLKMGIAQEKLVDKIMIMDASPAFVEKERGLYLYNVIIKVAPEVDNYREFLKYVTTGWIIDIDPRTVL